ncbi:MAG: ABC transporter substrate-binding protein, partial [Ruminococcaceae bacterium]|nr:ABC transporter substrate-binding protein [Oscillospiraceae bacterium]
LTGCFSATESTETPDFWEVELPEEPPPRTKEPEKVTEFTLPYFNSQTLDPIACSDGAQQVVASLLYEGLFVLDESFTPQPRLCASYSKSSNGLTYTFRMREDVAFSDGTVFTGNDVLTAYRRAQVSDRYSARFANVASMRLNRGALVITLMQPDSALPALLDIPIVKAGTEKDTVPLGTGPYWFSDGEDGACLMRRENWWQKLPLPVERIALKPVRDADTAVYLFSAESAHLLTADLLCETPASALGGVTMTDASTTALLFLGFNAAKRSTLSSVALRTAMNAALDRTSIVSTLLANHAVAAQFPISPASPLYPTALEQPFESGAYAEALDPAGDNAGAPTELRLVVNEENSFKVSLAEHLARQLSAAHITVTVAALPWSEYLSALEKGNFDLWLGEVRLTADWDVSALVGTNGALNYGKFSSAELDKALAAFLKEENEKTAAAFCERLIAEAPILPLAFKSLTVLTREGVVDGLHPTAAQPFYGIENWSIRIP